MSLTLYFALACAILLSNFDYEMAQNIFVKIGSRRFDVFSEATSFAEARRRCKNHGWQLAHIKKRAIALMLQKSIFSRLPSKQVLAVGSQYGMLNHLFCHFEQYIQIWNNTMYCMLVTYLNRWK